MAKFLSTKYSARSFNIGMLVLRVATGALLIPHGYSKLVRFNELQHTFMNFMGLGSTFSLILILFAEVFCAVLLILGLFTRFAVIPIIIAMGVVVFISHDGDIFGKGELPMLYLAASFMILLCGPGKISVDSMIGK